MSRTTKSAFLLVWLLTFTLAAFVPPAAAEDMDKEVKKLQGKWEMVAGERDGEKLSDEHVKPSTIVYEGKTITVFTPHQSKEPIIVDIKNIDVSEDGNVMHFVRRNGPGAGKEMTGAYRFTGPDEYIFVFDPEGKSTPKDLNTKKGSGHMAHTWKRVK